MQLRPVRHIKDATQTYKLHEVKCSVSHSKKATQARRLAGRRLAGWPLCPLVVCAAGWVEALRPLADLYRFALPLWIEAIRPLAGLDRVGLPSWAAGSLVPVLYVPTVTGAAHTALGLGCCSAATG